MLRFILRNKVSACAFEYVVTELNTLHNPIKLQNIFNCETLFAVKGNGKCLMSLGGFVSKEALLYIRVALPGMLKLNWSRAL